MKFGVREICDVVLKAKATQTIGSKVFYKDEPVLYFDSLKTSTMEGAATTVYAQGGKGNTRLIAWEGERTVTFTMEDALISAAGLSILTGANIIEANGAKKATVIVNDLTVTKTDTGATIAVSGIKAGAKARITITNGVYGKFEYNTAEGGAVVIADNSITITDTEIASELNTDATATVVYTNVSTNEQSIIVHTTETTNEVVAISNQVQITLSEEPYIDPTGKENSIYVMVLDADGEVVTEPYCLNISKSGKVITIGATNNNLTAFTTGCTVLVDYYVERTSGAMQIDITPDKFGGNYYLEASTLFRNTKGQDLPAEFIIPNCKVQSNFTFSMASSGDPSTFTFTMDAFPDYTKWDKTKKVLAAIQVITEGKSETSQYGSAREATEWNY